MARPESGWPILSKRRIWVPHPCRSPIAARVGDHEPLPSSLVGRNVIPTLRRVREGRAPEVVGSQLVVTAQCAHRAHFRGQ